MMRDLRSQCKINAINIQDALLYATNQFKTSIDLMDTARIDAEILLAYVLNKTRTSLYIHVFSTLNEAELNHFQQCIEKRLAGIPIAYIVGQREFWSLTFDINEHVLIPRPETELLVELALKEGDKRLNLNVVKEKESLRILDLGTGSGAIAVAIATEKPQWHITAIDICPQALSIARHNAQKYQCNNITFFQSSWFEAIPPDQTFDIIIANPPYIAAEDEHLMQGDVRFEPKKALVSPQDGLSCLFHIIQYSLARLSPKGLLLIEHGGKQYDIIKRCFETHGFQDVRQYHDLQNHIRVTVGTSCQI